MPNHSNAPKLAEDFLTKWRPKHFVGRTIETDVRVCIHAVNFPAESQAHYVIRTSDLAILRMLNAV